MNNQIHHFKFLCLAANGNATSAAKTNAKSESKVTPVEPKSAKTSTAGEHTLESKPESRPQRESKGGRGGGKAKQQQQQHNNTENVNNNNAEKHLVNGTS